MDKFTEGAILRLKSGGPEMTYLGQDEKDECMCVWFEGKTKDGTFPTLALELVRPKFFN